MRFVAFGLVLFCIERAFSQSKPALLRLRLPRIRISEEQSAEVERRSKIKEQSQRSSVHRLGQICILNAYACVLLRLARFGQVITDRVNVWFWNAALNRLSTLTRLTRCRTLLRFYFLRHLRPSKSCLRWHLHATSNWAPMF